MARDFLVVTCEHGGNRVPARYRALFGGRRRLLRSHRGYDPGALALARRIAARERAPLIGSTISRLVVELNRSEGHPALFSEVTRGLDPDERRALLDRYYYPYRQRVETAILRGIRRSGTAIHLSVHTFTPVLAGVRRRADVGLLYDPRRAREKAFCARMKEALALRAPGLRVRSNYPYLGRSDGLTTAMRRRFPPSRYLGIEIELNQALAKRGGRWFAEAGRAVAEAVSEARKKGTANGIRRN